MIAAYFVTSSLNYLFSALFFFHRTHCGVTFVDGKSCNRQLSYTIVTVRQYTHTFNVLIYVIWAEFDWDMVHTSSNQFVSGIDSKKFVFFFCWSLRKIDKKMKNRTIFPVLCRFFWKCSLHTNCYRKSEMNFQLIEIKCKIVQITFPIVPNVSKKDLLACIFSSKLL